MTIQDLEQISDFHPATPAADPDTEITGSFCCDLLSVAMRGSLEGRAWCTVMNNINTLAVASLTDAACIIMCCGIPLNPNVKEKALQQHICVYETDLPVFEAALEVYKKIHENKV